MIRLGRRCFFKNVFSLEMWFYFLAGAGAGSLRNRKSQLGVCDVVIPSRAGVAASKCVEVAITQVSLALNTPSVFCLEIIRVCAWKRAAQPPEMGQERQMNLLLKNTFNLGMNC